MFIFRGAKYKNYDHRRSPANIYDGNLCNSPSYASIYNIRKWVGFWGNISDNRFLDLKSYKFSLKELQQYVEFVQSDVVLQSLFSTLKIICIIILFFLLSIYFLTDHYPVCKCLLISQIHEKKFTTNNNKDTRVISIDNVPVTLLLSLNTLSKTFHTFIHFLLLRTLNMLIV